MRNIVYLVLIWVCVGCVKTTSSHTKTVYYQIDKKCNLIVDYSEFDNDPELKRSVERNFRFRVGNDYKTWEILPTKEFVEFSNEVLAVYSKDESVKERKFKEIEEKYNLQPSPEKLPASYETSLYRIFNNSDLKPGSSIACEFIEGSLYRAGLFEGGDMRKPIVYYDDIPGYSGKLLYVFSEP